MKRKAIIVLATSAVLLTVYIIKTGMSKRRDAFIGEFEVSEDGSEMTINVGVVSSMGFVRKVSAKKKDGGKLGLTCYSTFGGLNCSLGAKGTYKIPLDKDTKVIELYKENGSYQPVLEKDDAGNWKRIVR